MDERNEQVLGTDSFDATHPMNPSFVPYHVSRLQAERYDKASRQVSGQPVVMSHLATKFHHMVSGLHGIGVFTWNCNGFSLAKCDALQCLLSQDALYEVPQHSAIPDVVFLTETHCFVSNHVLPGY